MHKNKVKAHSITAFYQLIDLFLPILAFILGESDFFR